MSTELNQGEDYDEYGFEDESLEYDDEASENTQSTVDTIFGIPKNIFIISCGGLIVLILLIIIIAIWRGRGDDNSALSDIQDDYVEDASVGGYTDDYSQSAPTPIYDAEGNLIGNAESLMDGALVVDAQDVVIGIMDPSGVDVYDASNVLVGKYMSNNDTPTSDTSSDDSSSVDEDIKVTLKKLGYTGDEIQAAVDNGLDLNALVEEGKKLQDEAAKEALKRMSDSASKEFKEIVNNSIYCMPKGTFTESPYGDVNSVNLSDSYIVNADYDKLPTYGMQLFLKCKIANNTYLFVPVTPQRWETLPESGNIVLQIDYTLYGSAESTGVYVTNVTEVEATKITVNPQDSGSSMEDILNQGVLGQMEQQQAEEQIDGVEPSYE